VCVNFELVQKL